MRQFNRIGRAAQEAKRASSRPARRTATAGWAALPGPAGRAFGHCRASAERSCWTFSRTGHADTTPVRRRDRRQPALRGRSSSGGRHCPRPGNNRAAAPSIVRATIPGRSAPALRAGDVMHQPPPHEAPRQAFRRRIDDRNRFRPVEQMLRSRRRRQRRDSNRTDRDRTPPTRPLGQMACDRLRPPHPLDARA